MPTNNMRFLQILADTVGQSVETYANDASAEFLQELSDAIDVEVALSAATYMKELQETQQEMLAKMMRFKEIAEDSARDNANLRVRMRSLDTRMGDVEVVLGDLLDEAEQ